MNVLFKCSCRLLLGTALVLGSGCATKNPEWLTGPTGAFCATGLNGSCLKALAEKSYADATAKEVAVRKAASENAAGNKPSGNNELSTEHKLSASPLSMPKEPIAQADLKHTREHDSQSVQEVSQLNEKPLLDPPLKSDIEKPATEDLNKPTTVDSTQGADSVTNHNAAEMVNDSIPSLAFGIAAIGATAKDADGYQPTEQVVESLKAGGFLNVGTGPVTDAQIGEAKRIADKALRADTLTRMLSLRSRSMTEEQVNGVLNELYVLDKGQYANALIVKLPGLLKVGDLERAKALQSLLLNSPVTKDRPFSMLAFVATCYTMAGMKQDAGDIVRDAIRGGVELTPDDQKLIRLSITVANGSYPMMQEFYDFESDNARLSAYLTIAVVARQLDMPTIAHHSIADAVKFIQKAAVKVDRQKALSQILSVSPGII